MNNLHTYKEKSLAPFVTTLQTRCRQYVDAALPIYRKIECLNSFKNQSNFIFLFINALHNLMSKHNSFSFLQNLYQRSVERINSFSFNKLYPLAILFGSLWHEAQKTFSAIQHNDKGMAMFYKSIDSLFHMIKAFQEEIFKDPKLKKYAEKCEIITSTLEEKAVIALKKE